MNLVLDRTIDYESLEELSHEEVFQRCLARHNINNNDAYSLKQNYQQVIVALQEDGFEIE